MQNLIKFKKQVALCFVFSFIFFGFNHPKEVMWFESDSGLKQKELVISDLNSDSIIMGAQQIATYLPKIKNKRVGLVINASSQVHGISLLDFFLEKKIKVQKVFSPEHGFRGLAEAGEWVKNEVDVKTGTPIISLYGKNKKPTPAQLEDVDVLLFDIQDVGVRFYTYISTLHYVMEAAAHKKIPIIVLDRPNPNAHYIDGPILEKPHQSFVGMHPGVPVVYGMTIGEYALMINGENWLGSVKADLTVVPLKNYTHNTFYDLPVAPSPNLRNKQAIALYPSLCFFEGTRVSVGRGTQMPFQIYGMPASHWKTPKTFPFSFKPESDSKVKPLYNKQICLGEDLTNEKNLNRIRLDWLIKAYKESKDQKSFFLKNNFIDKLAGNAMLKLQIKQHLSEEQIRKSWEKGLKSFKAIRAKYLLYSET